MQTASHTNRFLAAFNRIDELMRKRCQIPLGKGEFSAVLSEFEKRTYFTDRDFLLLANRLRNVIVHDKRDPVEELATPALRVVERMERISKELEAPEKVERRFVKDEVATVSFDQTLKGVLKMISENQFSQFPVIHEGKIVALLTENGITRWLSSAVAMESMIEFADVTVATVLGHEEKRENMILISRLRELNEVRLQFSKNSFLEAAIITQAGKPDQNPLGIITRWDLIEPNQN
jgi:predicted transcriptional regulator